MSHVSRHVTEVVVDNMSFVEQVCSGAFDAVTKLLDGYVCVGGSFSGQLNTHAAPRGSLGVDFVWDLWNEQFSTYWYTESGAQVSTSGGSESRIELGASAYTGLGFCRADHVHAAWSGGFQTVEASIGREFGGLITVSGTLQAFRGTGSWDMVGALVGVSGAVTIPTNTRTLLRGLRPRGLAASAAYTEGCWTPYDELTQMLHSPGRRRAQPVAIACAGTGTRNYALIDLSDTSKGVFGVAAHMARIMGPANPLIAGYGGYATSVALAKRQIHRAGISGDRTAALAELRRRLCNEPYQLIRQYESQRGTGLAAPTDQLEVDHETRVQRTPQGNYIIDMTHSVPSTGEWTTTLRLYGPQGNPLRLPGILFSKAHARAPNGFINGRSYPAGAFEHELNDWRQRAMAFH